MSSLLLTVELEVEVFYHHGRRQVGEDEQTCYPDEAHIHTICPREVGEWAAHEAIKQFEERVRKGKTIIWADQHPATN